MILLWLIIFIMIKRWGKSNQTELNILKVLESKDFLAVDHNLGYYILSPIEGSAEKSAALIKTKLKGYDSTENNIIAPC